VNADWLGGFRRAAPAVSCTCRKHHPVGGRAAISRRRGGAGL